MAILDALLSLVTAPYHGSLQQYTLSPCYDLATEKDKALFGKKLHSWQLAKAHELKVVQVSVCHHELVDIFRPTRADGRRLD